MEERREAGPTRLWWKGRATLSSGQELVKPIDRKHRQLDVIHRGDPQSFAQASRGARRSTISFAIFSDAVAPGDGALLMLVTRSVSWIKKSSTRQPSLETAWARTPAGARSRCSARISGTSRWSALTNADLLTDRHISPSPIFQYFAAILRKPRYVSVSVRSVMLTSVLW